MNLMSLTAVELGKKIKSGEVRVVDAVNAAFDQIEAVEKDINSYVTVYKKEEVLPGSIKPSPYTSPASVTMTMQPGSMR